MMFDDYKKDLQKFYKRQKDSGNLTSGLEYPNRTKLKKEFLKVFTDKKDRESTKIIKDFFDPEGKYADPLESIDQIELDKLRPLITFLNGETILQADEPVHALAWLLGFTPYTEWKALKDGVTTQPPGKESTSDNNSTLVEGTEVTDEPGSNGDESVTPTDETGHSKTFPKIFFIDIALILLLVVAILWQGMLAYRIYKPSANQKCMYWDGNRYVPTECDEYTTERTIIPLDIRALNNFKKIRWPDLLTKKEIGKVWYVRIDGEHEFFTDSGRYPLDPKKKLKPLSTYILSNHTSFYRFILQCLIWSTLLVVIAYIRIKKFLITTSSAVATKNHQ